jgi:cation transport ATPase
MKQLFVLLISLFFSVSLFAQSDIKTDSFKVDGTCSMCKKRIEDAAYVKGVKRADWNEATHELTVIYRTSKTSTESIAKSIAKAGHSSEKIQATEEDYNNLPDCCHYKTATCEH